jgi:predicted helicase
MNAFTDIYVLDLHGNAKKKERCPDGSPDENVFDIQQGVAIAILVKEPGKKGLAAIHRADLWGTRQSKYTRLAEEDIATSEWMDVSPSSPFYLFAPQDIDVRQEYERGWGLPQVLMLTSTGVKTHRDHFVVSYGESELRDRIGALRDARLPDNLIRDRYELTDTRDWKLTVRRKSLMLDSNWERGFTTCTYRPFDFRPLFFHRDVVELPREEVMNHLRAGYNVALGVGRQGLAIGEHWDIVIATGCPIDTNVFRRGGVQVFPIYLYPTREGEPNTQSEMGALSPWPEGKGGRRPNLAPAFVADMEKCLGLTFIPDGRAISRPPSAQRTCSTTCTPSCTRPPIGRATRSC